MYTNVEEFCKMQYEVAMQLKEKLDASVVEVEYHEVFPAILVGEKERLEVVSICGHEYPVTNKMLRFRPAEYTKMIPESILLFETKRRRPRIEICFSFWFKYFMSEADMERIRKILQKTLKTQIHIQMHGIFYEGIFSGMDVEISKNPSKILK